MKEMYFYKRNNYIRATYKYDNEFSIKDPPIKEKVIPIARKIDKIFIKPTKKKNSIKSVPELSNWTPIYTAKQ